MFKDTGKFPRDRLLGENDNIDYYDDIYLSGLNSSHFYKFMFLIKVGRDILI